jgi:hypothetical protein
MTKSGKGNREREMNQSWIGTGKKTRSGAGWRMTRQNIAVSSRVEKGSTVEMEIWWSDGLLPGRVRRVE